MTDGAFVTFICLLVFVHSLPITSSYHWRTRRLQCTHYGDNNTRCSLMDPNVAIEQNPGCFEEIDKANATRVYCGIGCEESEESTVVTKKPQWNHQCSMFYTYNLERRRKDWYLWRKEGCINTTITFDVSCGMHRDPRRFYFNNEHLFEYEDAE
ncbi:hypothetical protein GCK32_000473 [Trichostrongylus colubriformis]|uniref:DUF7808 domain-containing protein n=1 Tax=Trichostrongylus colubriformis TaxID=6319 RepID=A0AAN8IAA8_TRICO